MDVSVLEQLTISIFSPYFLVIFTFVHPPILADVYERHDSSKDTILRLFKAHRDTDTLKQN